MINLNFHRTWSSTINFKSEIIPNITKLIWHKYVYILDNELNKPRSWWIQRGIPIELCETIWSHCSKVAIATDILIRNNPYGIPKNRFKNMVLKAWLHDFSEFSCRDYTPNDIKTWLITKEWKYQKELESLQRFVEIFWDIKPLIFWLDLENNLTIENELIHQVDKSDAWIMALNYESYWYNVDEFFEYTIKKLSDPFLRSAFEWCLDRKFKNIDYFYQNCIFLYFQWNLNKIRYHLWSK